MDKKKIKRWSLIAGGIIGGVILVCGITFYILLHRSTYSGEGALAVYIDKDDTADSVCKKIDADWMMSRLLHSSKYHPRTGYYSIPSGETVWTSFHRLRNGQQDPINLVVPSVRTMEKLAAKFGEVLMLDSAEIADVLYDSTFCAKYGYTVETMPALFIPNTYQCFWDVGIEQLMKRLVQVNKEFWTAEREEKAKALNFNHEQVMTLASIVDSETANDGEKPMVAGLYLNRIDQGILLQADPTVIFAIGDFTIRRVLNSHLQVDSPYNTYKYKGLPPGPIRIPSVAGIDAVLNHKTHPYIYMCAKEDFSGTHNFAETYQEHKANARKYQNALNERGIK